MLCSSFRGLNLGNSAFLGGQAVQQRAASRVAPTPLTIEAAHKKGAGSTKNGRDSVSKRRGVKVYGGQPVPAGGIIIRQLGTKVRRIPYFHMYIYTIQPQLRSAPNDGHVSPRLLAMHTLIYLFDVSLFLSQERLCPVC